MRRPLAFLVLPALLAGCFGTPAPGPADDGGDAAPAALLAPWWDLGDAWVIEFQKAGEGTRRTTLVNFANDTFGDPAHFWLGTRDRQEALRHVLFDDNPFLGRIHWEILAPHEKGMHSSMYSWPLEDGTRWTSPLLFGKEDLAVEATRRADGTFAIEGEARKDGARFEYDYDPATEWFRTLAITEPDGRVALHATVLDRTAGESGTFWFLRGRDYLSTDGGATGEEDPFTVREEGATSVAFLVNVRAGPGSALQFIAPDGSVFHEERLLTGGTVDKLTEIPKPPPAGAWKLRYVGSVTGSILVRGVIEYKATL